MKVIVVVIVAQSRRTPYAETHGYREQGGRQGKALDGYMRSKMERSTSSPIYARSKASNSVRWVLTGCLWPLILNRSIFRSSQENLEDCVSIIYIRAYGLKPNARAAKKREASQALPGA